MNTMKTSITYEICDLDRIYNENFNFSLPRNILEGYLAGKGFDYPETYTQEESNNLYADINEIFSKIISKNPVKEKIAVMTAGAPGAGKTIKLKQDLEENSKDKNHAYICPDDVCLKNQARTFLADLEKCDGSIESRQKLYNKWRPGSNAATHLILGNLIRENYDFYFGTTSSGNATHIFFDFLKKQGYKIRLIYVSAPDDIRWESIKERDKEFVQTTENDVREKGFLLPQRINDTFLKYADEIDFNYRTEVNKDAKLAARWVRNQENSDSLGTLEIINQELYQKIKEIHDAAATILKRPDIYWEASVEKNSKIIVQYPPNKTQQEIK